MSLSANKKGLYLDWATKDAAEFACKRWHYSGCLPIGKLIKVGVWEDGKFKGVVIFSRGTSPNLGTRFGLGQTECVELTRVALAPHKVFVSKVIAIALKMLKKSNPGLLLVVSFASQTQGHHGGIYQAGNWIYCGQTSPQIEYYFRGKRVTDRTIAGYCVKHRTNKKVLVEKGLAVPLPTKQKYRYIYPLEKRTRKKVEKLSLPYPSKCDESIASDALDVQSREEGAAPISSLTPNSVQGASV
jgi:hypothetical protein